MEAAVAYVDINAPLVERCRLNDRQAQAEIYRRYAKAMFNAALRITGDYAEAEDVLQESFLSAFRELSSYKGDSSFGAGSSASSSTKASIACGSGGWRWCRWASSTTKSRPSQRRFRRRTRPKPTTGPTCCAAAFRNCPTATACATLYLLEGYDHLEIASILDISESTSKSQYSRARGLRELAASAA